MLRAACQRPRPHTALPEPKPSQAEMTVPWLPGLVIHGYKSVRNFHVHTALSHASLAPFTELIKPGKRCILKTPHV